MPLFPPTAATDPSLPHDSLVSQVRGICSALLILTTLFVAARFWIRLTLVRGRLGADDACILVAWILAIMSDIIPMARKFFMFDTGLIGAFL